jgi:hypothetical protein
MGMAARELLLTADAAEIVIAGNMRRLRHAASLDLPDGTRFKGDVTISNTNHHTLTLLSGTSAASAVSVLIGSQANAFYMGSLFITGNTTRVALGQTRRCGSRYCLPVTAEI